MKGQRSASPSAGVIVSAQRTSPSERCASQFFCRFIDEEFIYVREKQLLTATADDSSGHSGWLFGASCYDVDSRCDRATMIVRYLCVRSESFRVRRRGGAFLKNEFIGVIVSCVVFASRYITSVYTYRNSSASFDTYICAITVQSDRGCLCCMSLRQKTRTREANRMCVSILRTFDFLCSCVYYYFILMCLYVHTFTYHEPSTRHQSYIDDSTVSEWVCYSTVFYYVFVCGCVRTIRFRFNRFASLSDRAVEINSYFTT